MRNISINYVKEGTLLGLPIFDEYGRILVNKDVILTKKIIEKLKEKGILEICIHDDISEGIDMYDDISQKLKSKTIKHLKNLNLDKVQENANKIVDELLYNSDVYEYVNIKTFDNYTYEHSIAVSVYSAMIGISYGFSENEVRKLAIGGMLHDIGKNCIDYNILNKPEKLTPEEYEQVKTHPLFGYNMLNKNTSISATSKIVILEHHENEDGTGYPRKLKSNEIYKFSKIVHIADVYDALISERPYKKAMNPKDAIDYIIEKSGTMFSEEFVNVFIQIMPSYSKGSIVELNDGRKAIVLKNILGNIHRPDIRILNTKEIIKLSQNNDIEIIRKCS